jgi:pyruvate,orthophosphate dikinase
MRWVYSFGGGHADGGRDDRAILGWEGSRLGEMSRIGLNVPPGFTVTTEACREFLLTGEPPPDLWTEIEEAMAGLAERTGKKFGDESAEPLLVSVRCGAPLPMPGLANAVLDLGLTEGTVGALARAAGPHFAWDRYRRFMRLYADGVAGVPPGAVELALVEARASTRVEHDAQLDAARLRSLVKAFRARVQEASGREIPDDSWTVLREAVHTAFRSWRSRRARDHRRGKRIPGDLGTAVNVMAMVYGNRGENSARGAASTRDPTSGEARLSGELLWNEPESDVAGGARGPRPIGELAERFPEVLRELEQTRRVLESHYRDMQRFEFTLERGELFISRTDWGERTGPAAVKIAADMADEGLIDRQTARLRVAMALVGGGTEPMLEGSTRAELERLLERADDSLRFQARTGVTIDAASGPSGRSGRTRDGARLEPLERLPDDPRDHGEPEDQEQVPRSQWDRAQDSGKRSPVDR